MLGCKNFGDTINNIYGVYQIMVFLLVDKIFDVSITVLLIANFLKICENNNFCKKWFFNSFETSYDH